MWSIDATSIKITKNRLITFIHCDKTRMRWSFLLTIFGLIWVFLTSIRNLHYESKSKRQDKNTRIIWKMAPNLLILVYLERAKS